jgi:hypothetical protein
MSRRIEVELTSTRDDGTWTWRAAGARQPKGELPGSLLYPGAKVGDVVRADADFAVEGITIVAILPPKGTRPEPERLEIIGSRRDTPGVTTTLVERRGRRREDDRRRDDGDRRRRDDGDRRRRDRGERGERGDRGRQGEQGAGRPRPRTEHPAPEPKPRARRLKAGRVHRADVLAALDDRHRPLAEELLKGGIPELRKTVERLNAKLAADGKSRMSVEVIVDVAEQLAPTLRQAEWWDRAEAALAGVDDIDLRDLRSVVVAADDSARTDETRELAGQLRDAVVHRVDAEHAAWLAEIGEDLDEGRVVRALRLSSRPPKAGAPFPGELANRLAAATAEGLTADISQDRYGTLLEALAFSPVRTHVEPLGVPERVSPALADTVRRVGSRLPHIASRFGIEPAPEPRRRSGPRPS